MAFGVDLGNGTLKVAVLQRRLRGIALVGAIRRRVPRSVKPEERKPALMKLLFESLGGRGGRSPAVVGLSGRDINLQVVQQPAMKPVNYRAMMGYELDQRRAGDEQLYADYCTLRQPDAYYHQYLAMVGVGKRPYVDERLEIVRRSGLDPRDAVPNAFALFAAYSGSYAPEGGTTLVLDIGADAMDMALIRGGKLIYARNISSGARLFDSNIAGMSDVGPDEAEWLKIRYGSLLPPADNADPKEEEIRPAIRTAAGQLAGFIQASVNHAKIEFGDRELVVDRIYVSGGGSRMRGFPEYLQSALKIDVQPFDPFQRLDTSAVEALGVEEVRSLPTDLAVPIGLARLALLPGGRGTLSILPDDVKRRRNLLRTWTHLGTGAAALLVALVILTGVGMARGSSIFADRKKRAEESAAQLARIGRLEAAEAEQRAVAAKMDQLVTTTLAAHVLLDVHSEIREFALKEEGISIREIRIVEPATDQPKGAKRCLFTHSEFPIVLGQIESRTEDAIRVRMDHPAQPESRAFPLGECGSLLEWEADLRAVLITVEVSADAPERAHRIVQEVLRRLTKPQHGQTATALDPKDADRAGWRRYDLVVRCAPRYE